MVFTPFSELHWVGVPELGRASETSQSIHDGQSGKAVGILAAMTGCTAPAECWGPSEKATRSCTIATASVSARATAPQLMSALEVVGAAADETVQVTYEAT